MAKERKAPKEGKNGVDRWTSNGFGIKVGKAPITKEEARKIDEEAAKRKKK